MKHVLRLSLPAVATAAAFFLARPALLAQAPQAGAAATVPAAPTDDELSVTQLEGAGDKAKAAFDAYKAGKYEDARKSAEEAAKGGDANGMFLLALCHQNGRGGAVSLTDAEKHYREAMAKGHKGAKTNIGLLLYATNGNDKDRVAEAVGLLRESAVNDAARVGVVLGELYARGLGVTADFAEAEKYFDAAVKAGQTRGLLGKAMLHGGSFGFEKQKDDKKADEALKQAADAGSVEAMLLMGQRKIQRSEGKGADFEEGLKWIEKAGEKGSGDAWVALGDLYLEGKSVKKDEKRAVECYRKGEALGHAAAMAKLGNCHETGVGVEKDAAKAFAAYKAAADRGLPAGVYNLAVCYESGIGVEKSPSTAFRHYLQAAKAGLVLAMNETGLRYQTGTGVTEDVVAAAGWFTLAAQQNNPSAQVNLARLYLQGLGVQRNAGTAAQLYNAAAVAGSPDAAYELAQLLDYGVGGQRDPVRAHALYAFAADAKSEKAAERRDALAKDLTKDQLTAAELFRKGLPKVDAPADKPAEKPKAADAKKK